MSEHTMICLEFQQIDGTYECRCAVVDAVRERLVDRWYKDARDVHFNKAHDDLTPTGRVAKWLRTVAL